MLTTTSQRSLVLLATTHEQSFGEEEELHMRMFVESRRLGSSMSLE